MFTSFVIRSVFKNTVFVYFKIKHIIYLLQYVGLCTLFGKRWRLKLVNRQLKRNRSSDFHFYCYLYYFSTVCKFKSQYFFYKIYFQQNIFCNSSMKQTLPYIRNCRKGGGFSSYEVPKKSYEWFRFNWRLTSFSRHLWRTLTDFCYNH